MVGTTPGFSWILTNYDNVLGWDTNLLNATTYTPVSTAASGEYNAIAAILSSQYRKY